MKLATRRILLAACSTVAVAVHILVPARGAGASDGSCDFYGALTVGSTTVTSAPAHTNEDGPVSRLVHNANDGPVTAPDQRPIHQVNCSVVAATEDDPLPGNNAIEGNLKDAESYLVTVEIYAEEKPRQFIDCVTNPLPSVCQPATPPLP